MMTQYAYLRNNKLSNDIQILFSCNLLYIMSQYAYLHTNKFEREVQVLSSCNLLYTTTQYAYLWNNKLKGDTRWCFERVDNGDLVTLNLRWYACGEGKISTLTTLFLRFFTRGECKNFDSAQGVAAWRLPSSTLSSEYFVGVGNKRHVGMDSY